VIAPYVAYPVGRRSDRRLRVAEVIEAPVAALLDPNSPRRGLGLAASREVYFYDYGDTSSGGATARS
jgi:hypothetical protein